MQFEDIFPKYFFSFYFFPPLFYLSALEKIFWKIFIKQIKFHDLFSEICNLLNKAYAIQSQT